MKTHTPGPWLVRFDEDCFDPSHSALKIIDGRDESLNHTHGALSLAFINVSAFAPHMDEPLANARLIAAAPDLLIVLENLRGSIRHAATCKAPQAFPCSCDANQLWEMSGAAISKATGGAA